MCSLQDHLVDRLPRRMLPWRQSRPQKLLEAVLASFAEERLTGGRAGLPQRHALAAGCGTALHPPQGTDHHLRTRPGRRRRCSWL